jgi:flagellar biosynthetic protein FliS
MNSAPEPQTVVSPAQAEIPEHIVVLLLEAGQRFVTKAGEAIRRVDPMVRDHHLKKTLSILEELNNRLDAVNGGPLAGNLSRVYEWWGQEILAAGEEDDAPRLSVVATQMGEIRRAWEAVLFRGMGLSENPEF